jgi:arginyl-tRNA synthetase
VKRSCAKVCKCDKHVQSWAERGNFAARSGVGALSGQLMRIEEHLGSLATAAIALATGTAAPALLKPTQDAKLGDYQVNGVLPLAKQQQKNPREVAELVAAVLRANDSFAQVEVAGPGFINLRLARNYLERSLAEVAQDAHGGISQVAAPERVVVDFSSPNIAKQMHVGHIRSTILGAALVRLLRAIGHDVIGDNHLGDWGTQFGLLIAGMRHFGSEAALEQDAIVELERVYKLASDAAKADEAIAAEARAELAKLQLGEPNNTELWKRFVKATRKSLDVIYARLNVSFDTWLGESTYNDMLPGVMAKLQSAQLVREDAGAQCIFFHELENAPADLKKIKEPYIVQKKDGAFLYSTTDIAALYYRRDTQNATRSVYVVDSRQGLHFRQLFAIAKLLGIETRLEHPGFGAILGNDGKPIKSRDGGTVKLADVLDEAEARARARIVEDGLEVPPAELDEVVRKVGIGAVKFADLRQNRATDYVFDWDKLISFKGNSGPYLQYAYARTRAVFRKGELEFENQNCKLVLETPEELVLAKSLLRFGEVVHTAAESLLPHLVCEHLFALARDFSGFYEACPVLRAEGELRASRLQLTYLTGTQLSHGLMLLGIETIDRM